MRCHGTAALFYPGAPLISTLDCRRQLLNCAHFVAKDLDLCIADCGSATGNTFQYYFTVHGLFDETPGYEDPERHRKLWLESTNSDPDACRHLSYRSAEKLLQRRHSWYPAYRITRYICVPLALRSLSLLRACIEKYWHARAVVLLHRTKCELTWTVRACICLYQVNTSPQQTVPNTMRRPNYKWTS